MSTFLRLFRLGTVPKAEKQAISTDGGVRIVEHIWVKLKYKNFRAPLKRKSYQIRIMWGALMVTDQRIAAWVMGRRMLNTPLDDGKPQGLRIDSPKEGSLRFSFNAEDFIEKASGQVEITFYTPLARQLAARW